MLKGKSRWPQNNKLPLAMPRCKVIWKSAGPREDQAGVGVGLTAALPLQCHQKSGEQVNRCLKLRRLGELRLGEHCDPQSRYEGSYD